MADSLKVPKKQKRNLNCWMGEHVKHKEVGRCTWEMSKKELAGTTQKEGSLGTLTTVEEILQSIKEK
jgi:hypothetical protein